MANVLNNNVCCDKVKQGKPLISFGWVVITVTLLLVLLFISNSAHALGDNTSSNTSGITGFSQNNSIRNLTNPVLKMERNPVANLSNPLANLSNPLANLSNPLANLSNPLANITSHLANMPNPLDNLTEQRSLKG
jgi:hypothetical protein